MADMLATGLAWLDGKLTTYAGTDWTYRRGGSSCTVTVFEERQKLRTSDLSGRTKVERPDFSGSFNAAELDFGAGVVEPRAGDTIERAFGSVTRKFRIAAKNVAGEPGWVYCDPQQVRIRVFADHYSG